MLLKPARTGLTLALLFLAWSPASAENSIEFQTTYYAQTDASETFGAVKGDPVTDVDEEATVIEPIVIVRPLSNVQDAEVPTMSAETSGAVL